MGEKSDLKQQLKKLEEMHGDLSRDHKQLKRQMNETGEELDSVGEVGEFKRLLKDMELEKEIARNSANDLKEFVKNRERYFQRVLYLRYLCFIQSSIYLASVILF